MSAPTGRPACVRPGGTAGMHQWTPDEEAAALGPNLTDSEIAELETPYQPQDNYWW
ncbi:hypothetical protein Areg01_80000 [Actinoplanes regularis]|nr:hypothetical protein Areg01_80000 [Actinoplanes regularis]